jgi:hypothetical protein
MAFRNTVTYLSLDESLASWAVDTAGEMCLSYSEPCLAIPGELQSQLVASTICEAGLRVATDDIAMHPVILSCEGL